MTQGLLLIHTVELQSLGGPVMKDVVLDMVTQCPAVEYISF